MNDIKEYFLGEKLGAEIKFAEAGIKTLEQALINQRKRKLDYNQRLTVYGLNRYNNELVLVHNKLPKNF